MAALKSPRLRLLGRCRGLNIYLVDGEKIRNTIDIDFTCGGQAMIYPSYVPVGEIWIDNALRALDRTATVLHELVELELMLRGWDYDRAHDVASKRERVFRRELQKKPPRDVDLARVAIALSAPSPRSLGGPRTPGQRDRARTSAIATRLDNQRRDREIAEVLARRR